MVLMVYNWFKWFFRWVIFSVCVLAHVRTLKITFLSALGPHGGTQALHCSAPASSGCGVWFSPVAACRLSRCGTWSLEHVGSVVSVRGLSCPMAVGILGSLTRDQNHIPYIGRWILNRWTTREVLGIIFDSRLSHTSHPVTKSLNNYLLDVFLISPFFSIPIFTTPI